MKAKTLLALAIAATSTSLQASEINYNSVQAAYGSIDIGGVNLDGFAVDGSFKFNERAYGFAGYEKYSVNSGHLGEFNVGAGFIKSVSDKTDWVSEVSYVRTMLKDGGSFNESGYRVATGLRGMVSDKVELSGKINYTDAGLFGDGFGVNLGAVFHVNENFGITAGYDYVDRDFFDYDGWNVGARFSF